MKKALCILFAMFFLVGCNDNYAVSINLVPVSNGTNMKIALKSLDHDLTDEELQTSFSKVLGETNAVLFEFIFAISLNISLVCFSASAISTGNFTFCV